MIRFAFMTCLALSVAAALPGVPSVFAADRSPAAEPSDDGAPHTYVQKYNDRGERYSSERDAQADMEIVSERIRAAGYVILHRFVAGDAERDSPWNYYRFEITYIAPHHAHVDASRIRSLDQLKAPAGDCQVINPEFCL